MSEPAAAHATWASLMTPSRWLEVARIVGVGLVILLHSRGVMIAGGGDRPMEADAAA